MKIYAISDLHMATTCDKPMNIFGSNWDNYMEKIRKSWQETVTDEDIVLISGDISWAMSLENAIKDIETIKDLKGKKVMIRGNHDYWWQSISRIRASLPENFYVLQNDAIKFENVVICGSRGWTCEGTPDFTAEDKKLYLREIERFTLALKSAEKLREENDKLLAMIHYPPFNVRLESSLFTSLFETYKVDSVIYGHLHGKDSRVMKTYKKNGIDYYLTSCDQVGFNLVEIKL